MKRLLLLMAGAMLAIASNSAHARPPPLQGESVYQLEVELTDQAGKRWNWSSKRGQPQLVAMFYTSCAYICPLIVDSAKAVERGLTAAERDRLGILLISMDPERDTPAALQAVATQRKLAPSRWSLASPRPEQVRGIAGVLGVRYRETPDGEFNHSSALVLLDREGRVVTRTEQMGSRLDPEFMAQVRRSLQGKAP